jgi:hypothetical protein
MQRHWNVLGEDVHNFFRHPVEVFLSCEIALLSSAAFVLLRYAEFIEYLHLVAPPKVVQTLLPRNEYDAFVGDLVEGYEQRLGSCGHDVAIRWYWLQIIGSIPTLLYAALKRLCG